MSIGPEIKIRTTPAIYKKDFLKIFKNDFIEYLAGKISNDKFNEISLILELDVDDYKFDKEIENLSNSFLDQIDLYKLFAYKCQISIWNGKDIIALYKSGIINFENASMFYIKDILPEKAEEIISLERFFKRFNEEKIYEYRHYDYNNEIQEFVYKYEEILKYSYMEKVKEFCENYKDAYEKSLERLK